MKISVIEIRIDSTQMTVMEKLQLSSNEVLKGFIQKSFEKIYKAVELSLNKSH